MISVRFSWSGLNFTFSKALLQTFLSFVGMEKEMEKDRKCFCSFSTLINFTLRIPSQSSQTHQHKNARLHLLRSAKKIIRSSEASHRNCCFFIVKFN